MMNDNEYAVTTTWKPIAGGAVERTRQTYPTRVEAAIVGRHNACCAGAITVNVQRTSDWIVTDTWDKEHNLWRELVPGATAAFLANLKRERTP